MTTATLPRKDDPADLAEGIRAGNRAALARAITLVESRKAEHRDKARRLIQELLPLTGTAQRIGITGVPGVGKSTTIDTFGSNLTDEGHKVAVLAVDPSSTRTGGSILGDKTRMARLAVDRNAFIRPSPSAGTLGGVAEKTRETMLLCEAAGFDVILVETVGIGQSETTVANMVDFFLVLMLPGAGDELQGIKKGVLEIADMIAVNKADGEGAMRAQSAASDYRAALHILAPKSPNWTPPVVTISGLANEGLDTVWQQIGLHKERMSASGEWQSRRSEQQVAWMYDLLQQRMMEALKKGPRTAGRLKDLEHDVRAGRTAVSVAVEELADLVGV
ncbi:methylmalonyl-CoA mutase metallochaperone MeaB [Roseibium hamelinense]|uniref:Methylmalonyl-CoA mutase metallochaperone MeaB n=1 Tax=Roseibium hamelinense TaxID=150831 RepID=A0A562TI91_9HYPH|nr:methylmalonyl Co-A mutase-associated GTPase MeaB [Roseibium hamelinense]MTI42609.1 methylmalonyl Co-A mutase-associated GTPase MeaB [Roseibium hamelinense]TWI93355.1 methylmalonyl-CoA mutase metallochaperone MeaB [Roseibium hamelinense]